MRMPEFFDPAKARVFSYAPDYEILRKEASRVVGTPSEGLFQRAHPRVLFLGVDCQKDFCFPEGRLYVGGRSGTGAMDDMVRIAEFLYRNAETISKTIMTMDTHELFQIFHPAFWIDRETDTFVRPYTEITVDDLPETPGGAGKYVPNPHIVDEVFGGSYGAFLQQVRFYCRQLEAKGKYTLMVWPEHCLMGSDGHPLVGIIEEAVTFHGLLRHTRPHLQIKGGHPLTENYSVFSPEVRELFTGDPLINEAHEKFVEHVLSYDAIVIAGEAGSHCVKSSLDDLIEIVKGRNPADLRKIYLLEDCTSAVTVPDGKGGFCVDYTQPMEGAFARYRQDIHVVRSTDPMEAWLEL